MGKIKNILKLMRIKHYVKNLLIFLPLFFGGFYKDINNVYCCTIGFILFCIICSIVYIINDIKDIEKDRKHEIKKNRPLAAGDVSIKEAISLIIFLCILLLIFTAILLKSHISIFVLLLPIAYLAINLFYSMGLKNIALIDVLIIVVGFMIRLFFGACLINCEVSNWLYLTVMSGGFYLGFGKRRNEILKTTENTRIVLKDYNKDFLDKSMYVCLTLTIVFYSMWSVDPNVITKINFNGLIWTVPLLIYVLFHYSLIIEKDSYGDPVDVILTDKTLLALIIIYIIVLLFILL